MHSPHAAYRHLTCNIGNRLRTMQSGPDAQANAPACMHHRRAQRLARFAHARAYPQNINKCCHSVVIVASAQRPRKHARIGRQARDDLPITPGLAMQCAALLHPKRKAAPRCLLSLVCGLSLICRSRYSRTRVRDFMLQHTGSARFHIS